MDCTETARGVKKPAEISDRPDRCRKRADCSCHFRSNDELSERAIHTAPRKVEQTICRLRIPSWLAFCPGAQLGNYWNWTPFGRHSLEKSKIRSSTGPCLTRSRHFPHRYRTCIARVQ